MTERDFRPEFGVGEALFEERRRLEKLRELKANLAPKVIKLSAIIGITEPRDLNPEGLTAMPKIEYPSVSKILEGRLTLDGAAAQITQRRFYVSQFPDRPETWVQLTGFVETVGGIHDGEGDTVAISLIRVRDPQHPEAMQLYVDQHLLETGQRGNTLDLVTNPDYPFWQQIEKDLEAGILAGSETG